MAGLLRKVLETFTSLVPPAHHGASPVSLPFAPGTTPRSAVHSHDCVGPYLGHARHRVLSAWPFEAKPCQISRSVITGSSAYADHDDLESGNPPQVPSSFAGQ